MQTPWWAFWPEGCGAQVPAAFGLRSIPLRSLNISGTLGVSRQAAGFNVRESQYGKTSLFTIGHCTNSNEEMREIVKGLHFQNLLSVRKLRGNFYIILMASHGTYFSGDLSGVKPLFYQGLDKSCVLSSRSSFLAKLNGSSLDKVWLTKRLLGSTASPLWWDGTPWENVATTPRGFFIRVNRHSSCDFVQWHDFSQDFQHSLPHGARRIREHLDESISSMLRSHAVTVDLSGGMDSGAIATIASSHANGDLKAVTMEVEGVEDIDIARRAASGIPGVCHSIVRIPSAAAPYSQPSPQFNTDEPSEYMLYSLWLDRWRRHIRSLGSEIHLTGDGGDSVLISTPAYLADLAKQRKMGLLWNHSLGWARSRNISPLRIMRAARRMAYRSESWQLAQVHKTIQNGGFYDAERKLRLRKEHWLRNFHWFDYCSLAHWATEQSIELILDALESASSGDVLAPFKTFPELGSSVAWADLGGFARNLRSDVELAALSGVTLYPPLS